MLNWKLLQPQMIWAMTQIEKAYENTGLYCVWTSLCRPDPDTLHGYGLAGDSDADYEITEALGKEVEKKARKYLGPDFYVTWHKSPKWHLHCEYDPGNKGVAPYREDFEKLWAT